MHHPTDRIAHTTAFVTPVVEHWLEREIAQWAVEKLSVVTHSPRRFPGSSRCRGRARPDCVECDGGGESPCCWCCSSTHCSASSSADPEIEHTECIFIFLKLSNLNWFCLVKLPFQIRWSNVVICFCSFEFSCPILEKNYFIENVYIVLSCLIK